MFTTRTRSMWSQLSVSAFGSNHLQQRGRCGDRPTRSPFSIRVRIESLATSIEPHDPPLDLNFQYPRSDRITCNCFIFVFVLLGDRLSVSAFGSNHLQRLLTRSSMCTSGAFSIRVRIESLATFRQYLSRPPPSRFQYPRSDRITCNRAPCSLYTWFCSPFSIRVRIESLATSK